MDGSDGDAAPGLAEDRIDPLDGEMYAGTLQHLHAALRPRNYLEIGVNDGTTLALAQCLSIGIDPQFNLRQDIMRGKPGCLLYQMPSDRFFAAHDPAALLGGPIEMAFLDGMHLFEFLLRDFINVERYCRPNSVILLHDCVPTDIYMARRAEYDPEVMKLTPTPFTWTGDVWKTVAALREFRPDLRIHAFDAPPTGLIAITSLDPTSRVLPEGYFRIMEQWQAVELGTYGLRRYIDSLGLMPSRLLSSPEEISRLFWL